MSQCQIHFFEHLVDLIHDTCTCTKQFVIEKSNILNVPILSPILKRIDVNKDTFIKKV